MNIEMLVSSEDCDDFLKDMLAVCAEERTLLAVRVLLPAFLALHALI